MSGRSAATAMTKLTWFFASAFLLTSVTLTVISANESNKKSIIGMEASDDNNSLTIPLPETKTLNLINQQEAPTVPPAE
jgi:preprotein translocase subunit SecG